MDKLIEWTVGHSEAIIAGVSALMAVALVVVGMTKTEKDDKVVRKISVWVDKGLGLFRKFVAKRKTK